MERWGTRNRLLGFEAYSSSPYDGVDIVLTGSDSMLVNKVFC